MTIPSTAFSLGKQDDKGKQVIVNSVGGALRNVKGVVTYGPYKFTYIAKAKAKNKDGKLIKEMNGKFKLVDMKFTTEPYWEVLLEGYNRELSFARDELTFE